MLLILSTDGFVKISNNFWNLGTDNFQVMNSHFLIDMSGFKFYTDHQRSTMGIYDAYIVHFFTILVE